MSLTTIAIASYNNAQFIERCVDSVLNQTYKKLEILIIDDGSTDKTIELLQKYHFDNRIVIIQKENGGLSSVRQKALEIASGEFICFIDADDYVSPFYVERMLSKLKEDKSDICVCSTRFETGDGKIKYLGYPCDESLQPIQTTSTLFAACGDNSIDRLYLSDSWNKMYRISSLKSFGVSFCMPKGLNGSDALFNRLVSLHAPYYSSVNDELYFHVLYKHSAVHRKGKKLLLTYQIVAEESIKESHKLSIYRYTKKYIAKTYNDNLYESLVDENEEDLGSYKGRILGFINLRKDNDLFLKRVDEDGLKYTKNNHFLIRIGLYIFNHYIIFLPFFISTMIAIGKIRSR